MSPQHETPKKPKPQHEQATRQHGVWLPNDMAEKVYRLQLGPASSWRVFLAVLFTAARFGGRDAFLSAARISEMTGLASRTVKSALKNLIQLGLLTRPARYRHLRVNLNDDQSTDRGADTRAPGTNETEPSPGATLPAPRRCELTCTSPTSINSFSKDIGSVCRKNASL